jgi:hypothetical protein
MLFYLYITYIEESLEVSNTYLRVIIFNTTLCGLIHLQITVIKVKYVRIAVEKTTDTVYPYILSTNQRSY